MTRNLMEPDPELEGVPSLRAFLWVIAVLLTTVFCLVQAATT